MRSLGDPTGGARVVANGLHMMELGADVPKSVATVLQNSIRQSDQPGNEAVSSPTPHKRAELVADRGISQLTWDGE